MSNDGTSSAVPPAQLVAAIAACAPGSYLGAAAYAGLPSVELPAALAAVIYGVAVVGAAFILSWAAEAAQVDISAGLALALLAFLAILPEYAVDFVFALKCGAAVGGGAGGTPEVCSLALANMTGANRVLVGVGWPLVVLVASLAVWHGRRRGADQATSDTTRSGDVRLAPTMSIEIAFLGIATLYSLTLPLRSSLTLVDAVVFVGLFAAYAWRLAKVEPEEPDLLGVSEWVGTKDRRPRRTTYIAMFVGAALVILLSAEHFAEGLVDTGESLGVSTFLLVQWVAPLASESPELIVACLYAWRLKAHESLGTLLSSKVNQWTLLVGGLPIVFGVSAFSTRGLPLDVEQRYELLITAAQSLFAVALLIDRRLTFRGATALLSLFLVQFLVSVLGTDEWNRNTIIALSGAYVGLAILRLGKRRADLTQVMRDGVRTPPADIEEVAAERR